MKVSWWRNEFKVGLITILALVLLTGLIIRASRWHPNVNSKEIKIHFNYVGGLLKNAPVSMYGMEIGQVTSVKLKDDSVEVTARVDKKASIRDGYKILVDIIGIVGEKYIEIINGPLQNPPTKDNPLQGTDPASIGHILIQAEEIAGKSVKTLDTVRNLIGSNEGELKTRIAELKNFVSETRSRIEKTLGGMDALLARVNKLTEGKEGDIGQTITNLKNLAEGLNKDRERIVPVIQSVAEDLDQMLSRSSPTIDGSLVNLKKASEGLRDTTGKMEKYIEDLNGSLLKLLARLDNITDSTDQKLQKSLDGLGKSTTELNSILERVDNLVMTIEDGQGTIGKLVKEEEPYKKFNETMDVSKSAVVNVNDVARNMNQKLEFLDDIKTKKEYGLSYNNLSRSLQNELKFSVSRSNPFSYIAGLSVRENKVAYDLQVGRKFGGLLIRGGAIRSKAGIGFDYWLAPNRACISLEGLNITDRQPEVDFDATFRLFRGWHLTFGADDLAGSKIGLNFGIKTAY